MYKNLHSYVPFQHDNLEFKNNLINFARRQDKTTPEGAFSTVLIYANVADYVARHLLENLLKMVSIQSYERFGGVLFLDGEKKRTNLPLGELCRELTLFEFPGKSDFLDSLKEFNELRISVMHKLMELDPTDTDRKLDNNINRIGDIAEDLIVKYRSITAGLTIAWNNVNGITPAPAPVPAPTPPEPEPTQGSLPTVAPTPVPLPQGQTAS